MRCVAWAWIGAGCTAVPPGTDTVDDPPAGDEVACLDVDPADPCPDTSTAAGELVGTRICGDPVRQVVSIGAVLPRDSGDGACCYVADLVTRDGTTCTP